MPVIVAKAQVQQTGAPLFQAAGWVEPRPASLVVSSLAPGIIDELLVVGGQLVNQGEPLARLNDADTRIQLGEAKAEQQLCEADVEAARAEMTSARLALEKPIQLQTELAEAQSQLAKLEAELDGVPAGLESAHKRRELAEQNLAKKRAAGQAIAGRLLRDAEAQLASETAALKQLTVRGPGLQRQRDALQTMVAKLSEQLELKLDERRRLANAEAAVKAAEARLLRSQLAVQAAELQLSRMTINSPIDGRVLSIHATAGMRVVGLDPHSEKGSSAVVTLYDPAKLQVRVDVRLEDIPQVRAAQLARIETASVPGGLEGRVVAITSLADIQKNTLQVKVAIDNPPDVIRPEMLAQVTFLAPEQEANSSEEHDRLRVLVPRQLVNGGEGDAHIWVANLATKTAERRAITLGQAGTEELVEVVSGLTPTDKLISGGREALSADERIRVTAEDHTIGKASLTSSRLARVNSEPSTNLQGR
ncbi:MAG: efflux RND transporter periplasmic adaptor subunit [Planctomycetales bacterium]|nr:efflux RND transporter periplasmic adaptor subunit [Planctomycetales bacterium]